MAGNSTDTSTLSKGLNFRLLACNLSATCVGVSGPLEDGLCRARNRARFPNAVDATGLIVVRVQAQITLFNRTSRSGTTGGGL